MLRVPKANPMCMGVHPKATGKANLEAMSGPHTGMVPEACKILQRRSRLTSEQVAGDRRPA